MIMFTVWLDFLSFIISFPPFLLIVSLILAISLILMIKGV